MLFNSLEFIYLFLPITLLFFHLLLRREDNSCFYLLIISSLFFYAYWNPIYLLLLIGSITVNYIIAAQISASSCRSTLISGVIFNLSLLIYFKYQLFFIDNFNIVSDSSLVSPNVILPLAISFFTFQQITYLVDTYRGEIKTHDLLKYTLFVVFFPQLIAGPIVHHREMMPQFFHSTLKLSCCSINVAKGLLLFIVGLFKKVVIADNIAGYINPLFESSEPLTFLESWTAAIGYTLQIYFDFSGYCEMAMGLALLFGIKIPINFYSPYKATNISEFWRRWHITLGRLLKNYLYIPLGGNHRNIIHTCFALIVTMLLGGLWHGASWTFVLWGALHGLFLSIYHLWKRYGFNLPPFIALGITLFAVIFSWILFRSNSISHAITIWKSMIGLNGITLPPFYNDFLFYFGNVLNYQTSPLISGLEIFIFLVALCFVITQKNIHETIDSFHVSIKSFSTAAILVFSSIIFINDTSDFLYFNF